MIHEVTETEVNRKILLRKLAFFNVTHSKDGRPIEELDERELASEYCSYWEQGG
jgi:hypothetical protein